MEYNEKGEVIVSGNATTIWNIQPTDRIKVIPEIFHYASRKYSCLTFKGTASIMRFDRGSWVATPYSVNVLNLCPILHVKNDFWYAAWIKHVVNAEQIQNKCLQPGVWWSDIVEAFP